MKNRNGQDDSAKRRIIASRLREERTRIEPRQGEFAARVGVTQVKQSALENGSNELRGEYLADIAELGIDVGYVLTGNRSGEGLTGVESELLRAIRHLSQRQINALAFFLGTLLSSADGD